jgi:hypothetical protein
MAHYTTFNIVKDQLLLLKDGTIEANPRYDTCTILHSLQQNSYA